MQNLKETLKEIVLTLQFLNERQQSKNENTASLPTKLERLLITAYVMTYRRLDRYEISAAIHQIICNPIMTEKEKDMRLDAIIIVLNEREKIYTNNLKSIQK